MYDELARIESIYGSVAEYNRCMEEEQQEKYTPTQEEQDELWMSQEVYYKKIECLSGIPSDFIVQLRAEIVKNAPKEEDYIDKSNPYWQNSYIYARNDYYSEATKEIVKKVCEHYNVTADTEWETFYSPQTGKLAISVEYSEHSLIKHTHIGNLDYEAFKDIYRDLYYAGLYPSVSLGREEKRPIIISNSSLGNLRIYDFKMAGLETEESLNKDLQESGFDEKAFRDELREQLNKDENDDLDDR